MEPNTFKYASPRLQNNINLAKLFIEKGGSFNLLSKNMRNDKKIAISSIQINPKIYQHLNKKLKDDDEIFEIVVKLNKRVIGYASERLRAICSKLNDNSN